MLLQLAMRGAGSARPSLAAMFPSTCLGFRMPGMTVLTAGCCRMNRSASSGIHPGGTTGGAARPARASAPGSPDGNRCCASPRRPGRCRGQRAGQAALVERHARDHGDVVVAALRKELVLRRLVEDVVDDLHASMSPVSSARSTLAGCQRLMLIPIARTSPSSFIRRPRAASASSSAQVSLQTWNCWRSIVETPRFARLFSVYSRMWSGGYTSSSGYPARAGHRRFFGGILVADVEPLCRVAFQQFAEQLLAVPVTVHPRRVEEVAAQLDGAVERGQRLLVVASGPSCHAPHAVADLRDVPSGASEASIAHR